jgi:inward rectifier potassium channel
MAPLEDGEITDATHTHDLAHIAKETNTTAVAVSGKTIRLGTPNIFRKDLYFFLMEGTWFRTFSIVLALFLILNLMFAGLYLIDPSGIAGTGDYIFWDAFCFSVQTMGTIGYGALHPNSVFVNTIVIAEAAVGLLFTALITGLVFAKASRPKASVLFSKVLTVSTRFGVPTLSFRVGNARGNDVVDAQITVSLLIDEITPEGEHVRRIHDLKLARDRSPFFAFTWSIMHTIDEKSPLYGLDLDNPQFISIMAVLMGHDGTYGQTIYARHMYTASDLKNKHRFVDVMRQRPDGQLIIDFHRFHDTQALP